MDYKRHKKYFNQNLKTAPVVVSGVCIALGIFMAVFLANTRGLPYFIMMPGGLTLIAIGTMIAIIRSAIKIPDSELDGVTEKLFDDFKSDFEIKFIPNDIRTIRYEMTNHIVHQKLEPNVFGTYCFEGDAVMAKRGNDGKSRSSIYSMSGFVLKPESVGLASRRISLISDNDPASDRFIEVRYTELSGVKLNHVPEEKGYEGFAKYRHLSFTDNSGNTVIEFPILADASADNYVTDINLRIQRAKEKAAE
ncbi:MAG: hypothetical protein ACI3XI_05320 [Eubacteriales bacterium]